MADEPNRWVQVRKRRLFVPFLYQNDHFAKTGSGQTWGKHTQKQTALGAGKVKGGWLQTPLWEEPTPYIAFFCFLFNKQDRSFAETGSGQTEEAYVYEMHFISYSKLPPVASLYRSIVLS